MVNGNALGFSGVLLYMLVIGKLLEDIWICLKVHDWLLIFAGWVADGPIDGSVGTDEPPPEPKSQDPTLKKASAKSSIRKGFTLILVRTKAEQIKEVADCQRAKQSRRMPIRNGVVVGSL
eukprot:CAMPEP_0119017190 /NCGR_PEP_ID=MMETSP1176-20130426/15697_1 /TAXON_ID=265551 /ORGANISM="Synedropsis recta cf, Strain CCMP1620" /LENGTH=119 /DNA_ID=CAMNT_0006970837 /DNA_START=225 /DNA_END=580 /DNA_ORIENTATION=+